MNSYLKLLHLWLSFKKNLNDGACWWSWWWSLTFSSTVSPAEVRRHHAIDIDPITQLQGDGHSEPAGAQPGLRYFPAEERRRMYGVKEDS